MKNQTYTIEQLCELTGFSRRTIRYYVQEGIIAPPAGRGRGGFYYDSHLAILMKIKELQGSGFRLAEIRGLLEADKEPETHLNRISSGREVMARYQLMPGVELLVDRSVEEAEQKKIQAIVRMARSILEKEQE
jgi:DNA-binding transcriptional MerR regulator